MAASVIVQFHWCQCDVLIMLHCILSLAMPCVDAMLSASRFEVGAKAAGCYLAAAVASEGDVPATHSGW